MIERFNFYDIYGYLLPGLVLTALLAWPAALISGKVPPAELGSALAAGAIGYVIGQVAHAFARRLFSDTRAFASEVARLPKDGLERLRERLATVAGRNIEVTDPAVFAICRRALQDRKRAQLADQFQGMYALARGLATAFYAAAAYYAGICAGGLTRQPPASWSWLYPFAAAWVWVFVAFENKSDTAAAPGPSTWRLAEIAVALAVLGLFGAIAALYVPPHPHRFMAFGIAVPFCILCGMRMHRVLREQDVNVAKAILNDFMVEAPIKPAGDDSVP